MSVNTFVESNCDPFSFVELVSDLLLNEEVIDHRDLEQHELNEVTLISLSEHHANAVDDVCTTTLTENSDSSRVDSVLRMVFKNVHQTSVS